MTVPKLSGVAPGDYYIGFEVIYESGPSKWFFQVVTVLDPSALADDDTQTNDGAVVDVEETTSTNSTATNSTTNSTAETG